MGRVSGVFCLLLVFGVCLALSQKIIPKTRSLSDLSGGALPILRVVYCATSGYHRALEQYVALLNEKYQGEVQARGEPFQHSAWSRYVSRSLTALKLGLAALLLFKVNLLGRLQSRFPRLVEFTVNNRMVVTMSIFLLISTLESRLSATGHFEIFYNDVPVWSKLASGRFPSPGELFQIIDNQILIKNTPKLSL